MQRSVSLGCILIASLTIPPGISAGTITMATWNDHRSDSKYNNPANWSCACIPNNTSTVIYDVFIPLGSQPLNVNISPTINALTNTKSTVNILSGESLTLGALTNSGILNLAGNASLVISNPGTPVANTGTVNLNSSAQTASLIFNSGGNAATFTLTGSGTIAMSGSANNRIAGKSGAESLINDVDQTIEGSGTIGNLASFTNNGTLSSNGAHPLIVGAPLTNWDGTNLSGGAYNVYANLQLNSIGSTAINALLQNAAVTINGSGIVTGDGHTNSLVALSAVTDSSLTYNSNAQITPKSGTLTISTSGNDGLASASLNLSGASLKVAGSLDNSVGDTGGGSTVTVGKRGALTVTGSYNQTTSGAALFLAQASTVIDNSTLTIGGKFSQDVASSLTLSSGTVFAHGVNNLGTINLMDSAAVADFRTGAAGNSFANLKNGTLQGGIYNVAGKLYYDPSRSAGGGAITTLKDTQISLSGTGQMLYGGAGGSKNGTQALLTLARIDDSLLSFTSATGLRTITPNGGTLAVRGINSGAELLLDRTSLTVAGNLRNISSLPVSGTPVPSAVTVREGSTLTVTGSYTQSAGASTLVSTGSKLIANGFSNGYLSDYSGGGSITVDASSTADFRTRAGVATFTNLKGGTLTGGAYDVAGTLYYDPSALASASGGAITTLKGADVSLTGSGEMLYGAGQGRQAFSTLANITDSNFMLTTATALPSIEPKGGTLAVSTDGIRSSSLTLNSTDLVIEGNLTNTGLLLGASSSIDLKAGSALTLNGSFVQTAANTTIDASSLIANNAFSQSQGSITTLRNGALISAPGLTNDGGSLFVLNNSIADFHRGAFTDLSNGTLGGGGSYTVEGILLFAGGNIRNLASGTSLDLIGNGLLLTGPARTNALTGLQSNAGMLQLDSGATLTTPGTFTNQGGTLTINAGSGMTVDGDFLNMKGGSVNLNGTGASLAVAGSFDNAAGGILQVGNTFDKDPTFTSHGFSNNGILVVGGGSTAEVVNLASLITSGGIGTLGGGTYAINGTFRYNGSGINVIGPGTDVSLEARGSGINASILDGKGIDALNGLDELAGTLALSGGQSETVSEGASGFMIDTTGSLLIGAGFNGLYNGEGGTGVLTVDSAFVNKGAVTVGSVVGAGSTLTVDGDTTIDGTMTLWDGIVAVNGGNFDQASNGTLVLDFDFQTTPDNAIIAITGNADLAGILDVNPEAGFTAALGDRFTILTFASLTGNFATLDFGVFDRNLTFAEIVNAHDITLQVVSENAVLGLEQPVAAPEPFSWLLLVAGLLAIGARAATITNSSHI